MKISKILQILFLAITLFILPQNAMASCDETYNTCVQKCDEGENSSETCYASCDDTYAKCLAKEQGDLVTQVPVPIEDKAPEVLEQ